MSTTSPRHWATEYGLDRKGTGFSVGKLLKVETDSRKCSPASF